MNHQTFLVIDTETGGLNPNIYPLLSIGLIAYDIEKGILGELEIFIKHSSYRIDPVAAIINGFSREEHDRKASTYMETFLAIDSFLVAMFSNPKDIIVVGHNVQFDVGFMKSFYRKNKRKFEDYFSYRLIDTNSIIKYLSICKIIPEIKNGLTSAAKHFNIPIENRHTALDDARATAILFRKLINLLDNSYVNV